MPQYVADKIKDLVPHGSKIVVLGCTYKPDIDDLRESPIMDLVELLNDNYEVVIVDPFINDYDVNVYEAATNAELVILGVHHKKFAAIDLVKLGKVLKTPVLLDTRNYFSRSDVERAGFEYHLLGASDESGITAAEREVASTDE
jgi:UDP-N-acetyl-D-mannosaminuronic acid dehydrogenase